MLGGVASKDGTFRVARELLSFLFHRGDDRPKRLVGTMPVTSDTILDWIAEDGYSLSEAGWIRPQHHEFYFEVTAEKDGHQHIARAPDRESAVVNLGRLVGCSLDQ